MTVCIGAITLNGEIVTVSDHMLSLSGGAFTAESVALKEEWVNQRWTVLFAGDVTVVPSLIRRLNGLIGGYAANPDVNDMTIALGAAFQDERRARAEAMYLTPFGVKLEDFLANGAAVISDAATAAVIRDRIERHTLDTEVIVIGHSGPLRHAELLSVRDPGIVDNHAVAGYWAIGSGSYLALSSLAMRRHHKRYSVENAIYHLCEAKFTSELAVGVGRETFVVVRKRDGSWAAIEGAAIDPYRKEWERCSKPRQPRQAIAVARQWLSAVSWADVPVQETPNNPTNSSTDHT